MKERKPENKNLKLIKVNIVPNMSLESALFGGKAPEGKIVQAIFDDNGTRRKGEVVWVGPNVRPRNIKDPLGNPNPVDLFADDALLVEVFTKVKNGDAVDMTAK